MDPVTGIGLTASVIQLVTFSLHAAQTIRELRQRGSVSSYDNVEYTANHLSNLIGSLQRPLQGSSTQSLSKDEKDLIDLGRRCQECAQKLQRELRKLKTGSRPSALSITRKAARAIWGRFKIEEISKQLESFQSTLETSLLHRLRYVLRFTFQRFLSQRFTALMFWYWFVTSHPVHGTPVSMFFQDKKNLCLAWDPNPRCCSLSVHRDGSSLFHRFNVSCQNVFSESGAAASLFTKLLGIITCWRRG